MNGMTIRTLGWSAALAAAAAALPAAAARNDADEERTYVVRVEEDGEVRVEVNGETIPPERIRRRGGRIIILDEDGEEMKSVHLFASPGRAERRFDFDFNFDERDRDEPEARQPGVMIGITMAEPGKALRHHLRLESGATTMISGLYEGLPADDAGLEQFDIIVEIDGETPADPQSIREALDDRKPGDTVTFTIIHEGRRRDVAVTLDAFDADRLDPSRLIGGQGPGGPMMGPRGRRGPGGLHFLFDPQSNQWFQQWFEDEGRRRELGEELSDALRQRLPRNFDERLDRLDERVDEIKEMIDRLVDQLRDVTRENRRGRR